MKKSNKNHQKLKTATIKMEGKDTQKTAHKRRKRAGRFMENEGEMEEREMALFVGIVPVLDVNNFTFKIPNISKIR